VTDHCEDCGNTLCVCPFDGVQASDVAFALLPPDLLARLRVAVAQAPAAATDDEPWCAEDRHIVLPSGEACVCGENRMELML
jgi:hypothetical protein